jgi:CubicO group peptidase (beta-lactamase class C family)
VPANEETIYNVASLSKPLATEVYLRFASQTGLSIDTPMADVWTDPDLTGDSRTRRLTPRHVLSHRTGFPNWRYQTGGVLKFETDPGDRFGYSGEGFEYLHAYLDRVSGQPLDELARSLVLDPAGMRDTYFGWPESQRARIARPSARGKWLESDTRADVLAADNVHTTARDYARFIMSIFEADGMAPALRGEQVRIQTDRKAELCKHINAADCPQEAGFGLGWEIYQFKTTPVLMHTGNDSGEAAIVIVDLQRRDAFIMLSNSKNGLSVANGLLDVLGLEPGLVEYLKRA